MGQIKLYRKFYCISTSIVSDEPVQNYTLIDPYALSANTYIAGTGATESGVLIESSLSITQDQLGVYYADLNPVLYASDITYDLVWFVNYTSTAPVKKLSTRFRINVNTVTNQLEIEYLNYPLEIEVLGKY